MGLSRFGVQGVGFKGLGFRLRVGGLLGLMEWGSTLILQHETLNPKHLEPEPQALHKPRVSGLGF